MRILLVLDKGFERATDLCGVLATSAFVLMLLNVFYDVVMRYAFNEVSIGMQELEWHLFSAVFLLGIPYALRVDGHVRVDVFYDRWTDRTKAWVNILGALGFLLPFAALIYWYGTGFVHEAWVLQEGSGDPGGLPYRYLVKALIPASAAFTALAGLGMITQALRVLLLGERYAHVNHQEGLA
ncbi:TRAP transporter small permease subunit [Hahella sp. SMD15-11]|uniref:TRAP transporter small permease protein n=1 Tax=Thermohahella caldifontis TaxID=3142973 RepID=A0AB39UTQ8_9GAMM